jgi:hypothetical protein
MLGVPVKLFRLQPCTLRGRLSLLCVFSHVSSLALLILLLVPLLMPLVLVHLSLVLLFSVLV